jgi:hypothetical protein
VEIEVSHRLVGVSLVDLEGGEAPTVRVEEDLAAVVQDGVAIVLAQMDLQRRHRRERKPEGAQERSAPIGGALREEHALDSSSSQQA